MISRVIAAVAICLLAVAPTAYAGTQLFEGSWSVKAFGNECATWDPTPGPYCGGGASESRIYSAFGIPQGILFRVWDPTRDSVQSQSTPLSIRVDTERWFGKLRSAGRPSERCALLRAMVELGCHGPPGQRGHPDDRWQTAEVDSAALSQSRLLYFW